MNNKIKHKKCNVFKHETQKKIASKQTNENRKTNATKSTILFKHKIESGIEL